MVVHLVIVVAIPYCSCPLPWILAESFGSRNFKTRWLPWLRPDSNLLLSPCSWQHPQRSPDARKEEVYFYPLCGTEYRGWPSISCSCRVPFWSHVSLNSELSSNLCKFRTISYYAMVRRRNFLRHHSRPLVVQSRVVPFLCTHATGHCVLDKRCHLNRKSTCFSIQIP